MLCTSNKWWKRNNILQRMLYSDDVICCKKNKTTLVDFHFMLMLLFFFFFASMHAGRSKNRHKNNNHTNVYVVDGRYEMLDIYKTFYILSRVLSILSVFGWIIILTRFFEKNWFVCLQNFIENIAVFLMNAFFFCQS